MLQIYSYDFVVGYAFLVGAIDFAWPVKVAFGSALVLLLVLAVMDFNTAYKNRGTDLSEVGLSAFRLVGEVISFASLFALGAIFLRQTISSVDLTPLGWEVKVIVLVGIALSLAFTVLVISDVRNLWRKGIVPLVLPPPQPQKDKVEDKEPKEGEKKT